MMFTGSVVIWPRRKFDPTPWLPPPEGERGKRFDSASQTADEDVCRARNEEWIPAFAGMIGWKYMAQDYHTQLLRRFNRL